MTKLVIGLAVVLPALAGEVVAHSRDGYRVNLKLSDGAAALDFLSESTFRFARRWEGTIGEAAVSPAASFTLVAGGTADALRFSTRHLIVQVSRRGALVTVSEVDGTPLLRDLTEPVRVDGRLRWERAAAADTRFYGLGARDGPLNLRGQRALALKPFLISSAGVAESHEAAGRYTFDFTAADRYRIETTAESIDYYVFYGPPPKEILEQYLPLNGTVPRFEPLEVPERAVKIPAATPAEWLRRALNAAMSGIQLPVFDLAAFPNNARARQLAQFAPVVAGGDPGGWRARLRDYFIVYNEEARDRGFPFLHPMPMQFSKDAEGAKRDDQFFFGDEFLVAPILGEGHTREVYLPQGAWTDLRTGALHPGRQTIRVTAGPDEIPVFARNGAIVPWTNGPLLELHYFPKLGGEFFFYERGVQEYSQVHAAPAADLMRLEIESKVDRAYLWVVHHLEAPSRLVVRDAPWPKAESRAALTGDGWFYDAAAKLLYVRARAARNIDLVVNIYF